MKKTLLPLVLLFMSLAAIAQGESRAMSTVSVRVVNPMALVKTADLSFGNLAAGNAEGTVVIGVDGSRLATGGVTLIDAGSNSNAASFNIGGFADAAFSIEVPNIVVLETGNGTDQMVVSNFLSSLGSDSVLDANGKASLEIGATLNVPAQQSAGVYNGSFDVIVAYN